MKSKNSLPIIVIVVILAIIGAVMYFGKGKLPTTTKTSTITEGEPKQNNNGNVFQSIKDAMSKSLSLKCEYQTGDTKTVAYIKGTAVKIDGVLSGGKKSGAIIKGDRLWTWDIDTKQGIVMTIKNEGTDKQTTSQEDIINSLEKQKQFCRPAVVSDADFNPPTDVKFQDLDSLMQGISGIPNQEEE